LCIAVTEGKIHNGSGKGRFTIATNWFSSKAEHDQVRSYSNSFGTPQMSRKSKVRKSNRGVAELGEAELKSKVKWSIRTL